MNKGQSAIIDALLFMLICASASALMFYTAGLYGENTTKQMAMVYNFEFAKTTLVAMHYVQDGGRDFFWLKLQEKLADDDTNTIKSYLTSGNGAEVIKKVFDSSPSSKTVLEFKGPRTIYCYESTIITCSSSEPGYSGTVFSAEVPLEDNNEENWNVRLTLYY